MAVSLRIPDDVKKRVDKLAEKSDTTTHAFMLEAIREKVEADEARSAFHAEAEQRLAAMKRSGKGAEGFKGKKVKPFSGAGLCAGTNAAPELLRGQRHHRICDTRDITTKSLTRQHKAYKS